MPLPCNAACTSLLSAVVQEAAKKQKQANEVKAATAAEAQQRVEDAKEKGKKGGEKAVAKWVPCTGRALMPLVSVVESSLHCMLTALPVAGRP